MIQVLPYIASSKLMSRLIHLMHQSLRWARQRLYQQVKEWHSLTITSGSVISVTYWRAHGDSRGSPTFVRLKERHIMIHCIIWRSSSELYFTIVWHLHSSSPVPICFARKWHKTPCFSHSYFYISSPQPRSPIHSYHRSHFPLTLLPAPPLHPPTQSTATTPPAPPAAPAPTSPPAASP